MSVPMNMDAIFEATHPELRGAARRKARAEFNPYSRKAINRSLQQMIIGALQEVGGQRWLVQQANRYPVAFMSLIGKYIPIEASKGGGEGIQITVVTIPAGAVVREDAPGVLNTPLRIVSRNVIEAEDPAS